MKTTKGSQSGIAHLALFLVLVVIAGAGFAGWKVWSTNQSKSSGAASRTASDSNSDQTGLPTKISVAEEGKLILPNGHADPTVLSTETGYRMYVNRQSGGPGGYLTYTSPDGITWTKEKDIIISGVATGRAIALPTGVRFYYPGMQPIKPADPPADMFSSFSTDGVSFAKDPGVILKARDSAHYVEGPTVFQLPDKTWRMYFNENSIAAGNKRDGEIWGATSTDGLTWTRDEKVTLQDDDREATQQNMASAWPQVLHPFVLKNPKDGYTMFYNTHSELYAATSTDGIKWNKIGKIGIHGADIDGYFQDDGTIRVYYGDHTAQTGGLVYMAVLKVE